MHMRVPATKDAMIKTVLTHAASVMLLPSAMHCCLDNSTWACAHTNNSTAMLEYGRCTLEWVSHVYRDYL
jgi:hypothetical protein